MLGIVALNEQAVQGAILQMINHGISTGALFLLIGMIYERTHTRQISDYGGIAAKVPIFTTLFIIVTMSSVGLPLTNGFVGEFLILSGSFAEGVPLYPDLGFTDWPFLMVIGTVLATTGVVLGAVYMLTVVRRIFFGPITREENNSLKDLNRRELTVIAPLIAFIFIIGLAPNIFLRPMDSSVRKLVAETRPLVQPIRDAKRIELKAKRFGPSKIQVKAKAGTPKSGPRRVKGRK
jgi:NADH-quinone oxidoreductase subunit M